MHLPANNATSFAPPPAGTHVAICYRVVDLGTQMIDFQGQTKFQHKIMLSWELPDELMDDGQPFSVHKRYTLSSHEKSTLRKDLESWRGKPFTDDEFGPNGTFDIKNVIGVGCMLNILHTEREGKTYANVSAVLKMVKGMPMPAMANEKVYFNLDAFDKAAFDKLSEGIQNIIKKSPEWAKMNVQAPLDDIPPPSAADDHSGEEIPF